MYSLEQISTENVRWALASNTEAQHLSPRVALAASRGTLLLSSARCTMLGDRTHWSWDWAATVSAGTQASTYLLKLPYNRSTLDFYLYFLLLNKKKILSFYSTGTQTMMQVHGVTPTKI